MCVCVCVCAERQQREGGRDGWREGGREGGLLGSPCYCSRCSGLWFSEGYDVLQADEGSLLCPQALVTPRLYSLLLCYVSFMCAEIGTKLGFVPKVKPQPKKAKNALALGLDTSLSLSLSLSLIHLSPILSHMHILYRTHSSATSRWQRRIAALG